MSVPIVRTVAQLRATVAQWRRGGARVAVVPTMGALHEGHLSLVRAALEKADRVIVTLFVNPKQFNSAVDLAAYPRTENEDAAKLGPLGAHMLYAPDVAEMYPDGFASAISVDKVSEGLCGASRPGHFDGVATSSVSATRRLLGSTSMKRRCARSASIWARSIARQRSRSASSYRASISLRISIANSTAAGVICSAISMPMASSMGGPAIDWQWVRRDWSGAITDIPGFLPAAPRSIADAEMSAAPSAHSPSLQQRRAFPRR